MLLNKIWALLQAPEGDGSGSGGDTGGSTPPAPTVDAGGSGPLFDSGDAGGNPPPPPETPPAPTAGEKSWYDSIPEETRNQIGNLKNFKSADDFAKSYINAQKMIGSDKIPVPGIHTSADEWKQIDRKLGVPEKLEDYKFDVDPKLPVDKDFMDVFKQTAHSMGVRPAQAKGLVEWFGKLNSDVQTQQQAQVQAIIKKGMADLKSEWGDTYDANVSQAKSALKEWGDADTNKFVKESGLGQNPLFLKFLAKAGSVLAEGQIKGTGGTGSGKLSPGEALAELTAIRSDMKHAYYQAGHPEHAAAKKHVANLYSIAHPVKKD